MKTDFKLVGLGRKKSMTCELMHTDKECFWPKVGISQDRFDALWDYFSGAKNMKMIAEIEHDGFYEDGTPKNPTVISVRDFT